MARKSDYIEVVDNGDSKRTETKITVAKAHALHGQGMHFHYRPDGVLNVKDPDNDVVLIIT